MELPQGYDQRPWDYKGDLYTASQMLAFRHATIEEVEQRVQVSNVGKEILGHLQPATHEIKGYLTETDQGDMVWRLDDYDEACTYCDDHELPILLYAKVVSEAKLVPEISIEQRVRDALERMGVPGAQNFSAGELAELVYLLQLGD